jgi:predicted nucleic acid-binding protein
LIAVDTSSFTRFFEGIRDRDTAMVGDAIERGLAVIAPVVLTELLSKPYLDHTVHSWIVSAPLLPLHPTYWERAGSLRATLLRAGFKAKLADCLIAQSCIDSAAPLITYDRDFRHFAAAGLRLL